MPGYEAYSWVSLVAPAKTPREIVQKLYVAIYDILRQKDVAEKLLCQGAIPIGDIPDQFAQCIRAEIDKWSAVVRSAQKVASTRPS